MPHQHHRINRAIHECVDFCCESSNYCCDSRSIVAGLAKFIRELRGSGDWNEADIAIVESRTRRLFAGIVDKGPDVASQRAHQPLMSSLV
jgi:hypothetical protein